MDTIFILGVGRSGTSAVTRILSLCGAALPNRLLRPGPGNPTGYWEPQSALKYNDQFMQVIGSSYHDPTFRILEASPDADKARLTLEKNIGGFMENLPAADVVVIKDPRISGLMESWERASRKLGHTVKIVHVFRNPTDVSSSLSRRYEMPVEHSLALWLKYNLLPERMTRHLPRVFISYQEVMSNWRRVVQRCNRSLGLKLSFDGKISSQVDGFLAEELQHHHVSEGRIVGDPTPGKWITRTYSALQQAAALGEADVGDFDRIYEEYAGAMVFFAAAERSYQEKYGGVVKPVKPASGPRR